MDFAWVYDFPPWLFALILIGGTTVASVLGMLLTRPLARRIFGPPPGSNEAVGDILQAAGVFYGITLGLIAVGAWSAHGDVETKVSREAAALGALYRDATCMPEPHRAALQDALRRYTRYVIDEAWPDQRQGRVPKGGVAFMNEFQVRIGQFRPSDAAEQVFMQELFHQYNAMMELRRLRLDSVEGGLPSIIWIIVFVGALLNIALVWCFVLERTWAHAVLLALLATLVALVILLTVVMDNPFRGRFSVGPGSFELIYNQLMQPPT